MDLMNDINQLFLQSNLVARTKIINELPVILILNCDILTLMNHGKITNTVKLELDNYHIVKSICHYLCAISNGLITDAKHIGHIDKIIEFISTNKELFVFEDIKYWCNLTNMYKTLTINGETISIAMKHTATLYQNELHRVVQEFKRTIPYDEWNQILVIITGPPSPRPGHSAKQYFSRLTGKSDLFYCPSHEEITNKKNRKLYYVENVYEIPKILDIVGQLLLERKSYDQIVDMKTDILAYDTETHLKKVCNK